jgi:hypothetical protein
MLVISASFWTLIAASPLRPCCCTKAFITGAPCEAPCCQIDLGTSSDGESGDFPLTCPPSKCLCKIERTSAIKPEVVVSPTTNDQVVKWLHLQIGLPTHTFDWINDGLTTSSDAGPTLHVTSRDNCIALCRFLC